MLELSKMEWVNIKKGFTIVELLIVIVVIAILAAVTIVAYTGIQNHAKTSALISSLESVAKHLETYRYTSGGASETYPSSLAQTTISSSGYPIGYYPANANRYYCIDASAGSTYYYQTSADPTQRPGTCPVSNGMIHWWPLNGDTTDFVSGVDSATVYSATPTTGQNGKANSAYLFANGSANYINTNITDNRDTFTFSIWVNPVATGSFRTALSETRDCCGTGYKGFQLMTSYGSTNASVSLWNGGSGSVAGASGATAPLNTWSFFSASYDGNTLRFYKDGALVGSKDYTGTIGTTFDTLKIGRAGAVNAGFFYGTIDDVRVFNRALSDSEIANIYTVGAQ